MASVEIEVRNTEQLIRAGAAIRAAGGPALTRELEKAMRRLVRPLTRSAREGAIAILPYRGGLAERVARSRFRSQVSVAGSRAGVHLVASNRYNLNRLDLGMNRHPVYPDTSKPRRQWNWVAQRVNPGWFTKPLELDAPKIRREIEQAIDDVARTLEASV